MPDQRRVPVYGPARPWAWFPVVAELMTDRLGVLEKLSRRHPEGCVVRLPLNRLVLVGSDEAVRHVLVANAEGYTKGLGQFEARRLLGDGMLTSEDEIWSGQRKAVAPLLRARRVHEHFDRLHELAEESVSGWETGRWRALAPTEHLASYTLAALGTVLGFRPPPAGPLIDAFEVVQKEAMVDASSQRMLPRALRPFGSHRLRKAQRHLTEAAIAAVPPAGPEGPPRWAERDSLVQLFLAGYETTASTLGWALYLLAQHPELQDRLAAEAQSSFEAGREGDPVASPLLAATVKEVLRLRPPVWLISRRARRPDVVDGIRVNKGDDVGIVGRAVHTGSRWSDPDEFRPERHLDDAAPEGPYIPFGAGPRGCPGGALADAEATLWLSVACRRLQFRPHAGARVPAAHARMSYALEHGFTLEVRSRVAAPRAAVPTPG